MTPRRPAWKRTRLIASSTAIAALTGTLLLTTVPFAQADETALSTQSETSTDSVETASESGSVVPSDAGITLAERTGEATGDALGLGYEQRVTVEAPGDGTARLRIYDPASRGGALVREVPVTGQTGHVFAPSWPTGFEKQFHGWRNFGKGNLNPHSVAVLGGFIYVSETRTTKDGKADGSVIYKFSPDGVLHDTKKYEGSGHLSADQKRMIDGSTTAITSLDAISYNGKNYLAVGLNQNGVRILNADTFEQVNALYDHWVGKGLDSYWHGDTISALKFGVDNGKLTLGIGKFTYNDYAFWVADALKTSGDPTLGRDNKTSALSKWQWPTTIAFGEFGSENRNMFAVGWTSDDRVVVVRTVQGSLEMERYAGGSVNVTKNQPVQSLRFFRTAEGQNRLAAVKADMYQEKRDGSIFGIKDNKFAELNAVPFHDLSHLVPGYKSMAVNVQNNSRDKTNVQFFSSNMPGQGCWLSRPDELVGGTPFPGQVSLGNDAGDRTSPAYGVARSVSASAVDPEGICQVMPGVFEVAVSLPDGSAEQVAKIIVDNSSNNGNIPRLDERNGNEGQDGNGRFRIGLKSNTNGTGGLLGSWTITIDDAYAAPTPVSTPTIVGQRLTPAPDEGWVDKGGVDDPSRPVYRFAVDGASWNVPGASDKLVDSVVSAPEAQASVDGVTWDTLGNLNPAGSLKRDGDTVSLSAASFDWQISPNTPQYKYFRVLNGDNTHASEVIDVEQLPAPAPFAVEEIKFETSTRIRPIYHNGLDQITSGFYMTNSKGLKLDPTDPQYQEAYSRVYFRDSSNSNKPLLTGLTNPKDPGKSTIVSTFPGEFTNDGTSVMSGNVKNIYTSTTNAVKKQPMAIFMPSGSIPAVRPKPDPGIHPAYEVLSTTMKVEGGGSSGLFVQCVENSMEPPAPCNLAAPTADTPIIFAAGEGKVGMQFRTRGYISSFPLGDNERSAGDTKILGADLNIKGNKAYLTNSGEYTSAGTFNTSVVTRGQQVTGSDLPMRAR